MPVLPPGNDEQSNGFHEAAQGHLEPKEKVVAVLRAVQAVDRGLRIFQVLLNRTQGAGPLKIPLQ